MSITKNQGLIREVEKYIRGGVDKKLALPSPGARFERIGTIFSRVTGLIKSGVMPTSEVPIWYSLYKTFPPKYEPRFNRPPLDIKVKEIFYSEDKLRASLKKWEVMDLNSTVPTESQKMVATFREKRTANTIDTVLIEELLGEQEGKINKSNKAKYVESEVGALEKPPKITEAEDAKGDVNVLEKLSVVVKDFLQPKK